MQLNCDQQVLGCVDICWAFAGLLILRKVDYTLRQHELSMSCSQCIDSPKQPHCVQASTVMFSNETGGRLSH